MAAVFASKAALRKSMLKTLRSLPEAEVAQQSQIVTDHILSWDRFQSARQVCCYLSMAKGELRTDAIVSEALRQGKQLYIPYIPSRPPPSSHVPSAATSEGASSSAKRPDLSASIPSEPQMRMLRLYSLEDMSRCPLDKWGILDPGEYRRDVDGEEEAGVRREDALLDDNAPDLDVILMPGVAFDGAGRRASQGKAFYDRFLSQYTARRPRPALLGLALSVQMLSPEEEVPTTESDVTLDGVCHPGGMLWTGEQSRGGNRSEA